MASRKSMEEGSEAKSQKGDQKKKKSKNKKDKTAKREAKIFKGFLNESYPWFFKR